MTTVFKLIGVTLSPARTRLAAEVAAMSIDVIDSKGRAPQDIGPF